MSKMLRNLRRRIGPAGIKGFLAENQDRYTQILRSLASNHLESRRPEGMSAQEWSNEVERFVNYITPALSGRVNGAEILWKYRGTPENISRKNEQSEGGISRAAIEEWVTAGRSDDPEGKDITSREASRTNGQIVENVIKGLAGENGAALGAAINRFIHQGEESVQFREEYDTIVHQWRETLCVIVGRDLREWARGR